MIDCLIDALARDKVQHFLIHLVINRKQCDISALLFESNRKAPKQLPMRTRNVPADEGLFIKTIQQRTHCWLDVSSYYHCWALKQMCSIELWQIELKLCFFISMTEKKKEKNDQMLIKKANLQLILMFFPFKSQYVSHSVIFRLYIKNCFLWLSIGQWNEINLTFLWCDIENSNSDTNKFCKKLQKVEQTASGISVSFIVHRFLSFVAGNE